MDDTFQLAATLTTAKKRRGRPRKADTVLLPAELTALGVLHCSERKSRKPRMPSNVDDSPISGDAAKPSMVGQAVYGVVDGSFDAGFLVSLRVGESENVYRGVVFGPGLSIPLSKDMDVATKVKTISRDDPVSTTPPSSPAPPAATEDSPQAEGQMPGIPPVFNGYGVPNSDLEPVSQQKLVNPLLLQSNFMHTAAASFQSAAQGFTGRGLNGSQYHFNLGTEFGYGSSSSFGAAGQGL